MTTEENITWEERRAATKDMISRLSPVTDQFIKQMDTQNGVYILAYPGKELGVSLWNDSDAPKVVYVGRSKFNSSRHFMDGMTGTSTIRRSLAALLETTLDLKPIPRSDSPEDNDRYNNYKLDQVGETKLSQWMANNFSAAFLELPEDKIESMELALIDYNEPMFNFQHNPGNHYGNQIKAYRKQCAETAYKNEGKYI